MKVGFTFINQDMKLTCLCFAESIRGNIALLINHEKTTAIFPGLGDIIFTILETRSAITTSEKIRFNIDNSIFNLQTVGRLKSSLFCLKNCK